jgi:hypothetical protein
MVRDYEQCWTVEGVATELLSIIGFLHKENTKGFIKDQIRIGDIILLLGNDHETNNEIEAISRQQLRKYARMGVPLIAVFSMSALQSCITRPTELR